MNENLQLSQQKEQENNYEISYSSAIEYISYKIPASVLSGSVIGLTTGYYAGDMLALYGYTYAFGFGLVSTSYFGGTYCLRHLRKKDDYINHAISGFVNAGWMVNKCIIKNSF